MDAENAYRANPGDIGLRRAKKLGFSDRQLARFTHLSESDIRAQRKAADLVPTYRLVDTCAAEFEAYTPYFYSTYGDEDETRPSEKRKIIILGGGPNRIGQGIEFDYCCVHAAFALKDEFETIMVNSNPETVSTDYDTSDKLYFEPLTLEDVLNIYEREQAWGAIVQFGGQTPLNLAAALQENGVNVIGTSPKSIEQAEDRKFFAALLEKLGLNQPPNGTATNEDEAAAIARRIGYPVLVRPSFVLGGRAMEIVYQEDDLRRYMRNAVSASPERPILVDRFLEDAAEVDVDCISDGTTHVIGAIMEHIEQAGIHSGDSACVIPPHSLSEHVKATITTATKALAAELQVRGLMNMQFAVKDEQVYVLEVNPRASRTIPFVSKAIGVPLAKLAAKVMAGHTLQELGFTEEIIPPHFAVKEAVFPFARFPGMDITLGPEMRSTGEVMGIDADMGMAYAKSQTAAGSPLPQKGNLFISVKDSDKAQAAELSKVVCRARLRALRHGRHRRRDRGRRGAGEKTLQARRRPAARAGHDPERRDRVHHQHAQRQDAAAGRGQNPRRRGDVSHPDHDHAFRRGREHRRHPLAPGPGHDGAHAAGIPRGHGSQPSDCRGGCR